MRSNVANVVISFRVVIESARHACGDILDQCSAERDVQKLGSAANCKNRFSGLARRAHKRYFSFIALPVHRAEPLVRLLSIKIGIDIFAAAEQKPVYRVHYSLRGRRVREGRNYDWYEAC